VREVDPRYARLQRTPNARHLLCIVTLELQQRWLLNYHRAHVQACVGIAGGFVSCYPRGKRLQSPNDVAF